MTDFSGHVLGAIAEPDPVAGITLSPDGSTLYAALVGSGTVSPAISVISAASLTQTTTYQLPAGDTPQDVAVQSGKLWVSYWASYGTVVLPCGKAAIGDFDLSDASPALEAQPAMGAWYSPPLLAADPTGTPNSVAIASSTGLVAVGSPDPTNQSIVVYTPAGTETNRLAADGDVADRGLGLSADGSELFAVANVAPTSPDHSYALNIFTPPPPPPPPASMGLTLPAPVTVGNPVAISGTLFAGGKGLGNTSVEVTRTGGGQPASAFTVDVSAGEFTWTDRPPVPGAYTYTASYPATGTTGAASASTGVTVAKVTPSLSLTVTPATAGYGQAVTFNAHLANTAGKPANSTVTVYAQRAGSTTRTVIASGPVNASGNLGGTAHFTQSTAIYAAYSGDTDNAAVTAAKTVNVYARVTAAIGGYYGTKPGYRLYHHTARLALSAAVAPNKKGGCVQFQVQQYVKKAWRAAMTTGCATLNTKSQAGGALSVGKYALGIPYRARAVYVRGKDTTNLAAGSGFLSFIVEK